MNKIDIDKENQPNQPNHITPVVTVLPGGVHVQTDVQTPGTSTKAADTVTEKKIVKRKNMALPRALLKLLG